MRPLACLGPQETVRRLSDPKHFPPRAVYTPGAERGAHVCPAWPGALGSGSPEAGVCSRHRTTGDPPTWPELHSAEPNVEKPHPQPPRNQEGVKTGASLLHRGRHFCGSSPPNQTTCSPSAPRAPSSPRATPTPLLGTGSSDGCLAIGGGLTSIILIVLSTVSPQLQGWFVPVSLRPALQTVPAYVTAAVCSSCS